MAAKPSDIATKPLPTAERQLAVERALAHLADRQHGVVAHWQLIALGLGAGAIKSRVSAGRLRPLHRGVYAVGTGP